jgi:hypothetical protein
MVIEWREFGEPPVREPNQPGYGTTIVREVIPIELGGTANLDFAPDGLRAVWISQATGFATRAHDIHPQPA